MSDPARLFTITTTLLVAFFSSAAAQAENAGDAPMACSASEHREFDFWLGEWQVSWPREGGGEVQGRATNVVESILGRCVILENFSSTGAQGNGLVGKSFSTYNPQLGRWQQTWVDNQGSYLDFTGGFVDGRMILVLDRTLTLQGDQLPDSLQGRESHWRMVWFNIEPDRFDWNWERSLDGGKTWEVAWGLAYRRKP